MAFSGKSSVRPGKRRPHGAANPRWAESIAVLRRVDGFQPALAGVRLIAVTLPGHGGTPPPEDFSIENYARLTAGLSADFGCDAVLGFSLGASVALEMVASGAFSGRVVLLGLSRSPKDEPGFFRAIVWLGGPLGSLPSATMLKMMGMATKKARLSEDRRAELLADFRKNDPVG